MYFSLENRAVFELSGPDAKEFLQGIITNDINKTTSGPIYAFLLSPQGKYMYDFFLIEQEGKFLLDYERKYKSDIIQQLKKYKVGVKVSLKTTKYKVYSSFNKQNNVVNNSISFFDPRSQNMGSRFFVEDEMAEISEISQYNVQRIKEVIPDGDKDLIRGNSFVFGCNVDCALDLDKGCYVGQEVVARTLSRGVIRKKLFMVECEYSQTLPKIGTPVLGDNNVGEMKSSIKNIGLALLRVEESKKAIQEKKDLIVDEVKIKVHGLI